MPSKELYLAAVEFQKAKLWEMLYDTDLFAVRYKDGEIGYVSVMGNEKSHFALALYMGEAGLYSFSQIEALPEDTSLSLRRDCFLSQECLTCSFEEPADLTDIDNEELRKYGITSGMHLMPMIRKYEPFKYPWFIDDPVDEQRLLLALKAGVEVARRLMHDTVLATMIYSKSAIVKAKKQLGFDSGTLPVLTVAEKGFKWQTEKKPEKWSMMSLSPSLSNELEVARLKKMIPKPGRVWYCHVMMFPVALRSEPPRFPALLVLLDTGKGMAKMPMAEQFPEQAKVIVEGFLNYLNDQGKPECIYAQGRLTYYLLKTLAEQIGITLKENDRLPEIEQAEDDLIRYVESGGMGDKAATSGEGNLQKDQLRSEQCKGTCALCGKTLDKSAFIKHLKKCEKCKIEPGDQQYFVLKVEGADAPEYFMYLDVMADTTLRRLDKFLRGIWLECCGHSSMFTIHGEDYFSSAMEYGDLGMNYKLDNLLKLGESFRYEYDFGSSTNLKLKVVGMATAKRRRTKILLLGRNIAPEFACVSCKKPAAFVRAGYGDDLAQRAYCEECLRSLQDEDVFLPILNSPRCGVCNYGLDWPEEGDNGEE